MENTNILFMLDCRHEVREQIDFINRSVEYLRVNSNWTSLNVSYMTHTDKEPTSLEVLTTNITEKANEISNQCNGKFHIEELSSLIRQNVLPKHDTVTFNFVFLTAVNKDDEHIYPMIYSQDDKLESDIFFVLNFRQNYSLHELHSSRQYLHYTNSFKELSISSFFPKICDLKCTNTIFTFESDNFQKSFYHLSFKNISHKESVEYCKKNFNSYLVAIETYEELIYLISKVLRINFTPSNGFKSFYVHMGLKYDGVGEKYFWSSGNPFTFYNELYYHEKTPCVYFNYTRSTNDTLNITDSKSIWKYMYMMDCEQILYETDLVCECDQLLSVETDIQFKPVNKPDTLGLVHEEDLKYLLSDDIGLSDELTKKYCTHSNTSLYDNNYYFCKKPKYSPPVYTYVRAMLIQQSRDQICTSSCLPFYTVHSESRIHSTILTSEQYCFEEELQLRIEICLSKIGKINQDIPMVSCNTSKGVSPKCLHLYRYGCTDNTHLQNCENFQCPEGFIKCPGSYCVQFPDNDFDNRLCPLGQERTLFKSNKLICSGEITLKFTNICIHSEIKKLVIDSFKFGNKKLSPNNCNDTCPAGYSCITYKVEEIFQGFFKENIKLYNFSNSLLPNRKSFFYFPYLKVVQISISDCKIQNVDQSLKHWNTEETVILDLSKNQISDSNYLRSLQSMTNLLFLNLSHNKYLSINKDFVFPYSLEEIDLSHTSVMSLPENCFENLTSLRILNLRFTKITKFENMGLPEKFKLEILDIYGLMFKELQVDFFKGLTVRKSLVTSDFKLCCQQIRGDNISSSVCHAPDDAISTCQHIVGNFLKRASVWIVGLLTIAGNGIVLIYRVVWSREKIFQTAYGLFVTGLAVSDLLMGVYLMIIAIVDVVYADVYVVYDESWRKSFLCHFSGFLSTLSSETSTFLIGLITLDRFISISYPFSAHDTSSSLKWKGFISTCVIGFVLALIPAVVPEWQIYSSNGLCLALPLSITGSDKLPGWEFSMIVYVILNFVLFLLIAIGQLLIFVKLIKKRNLPSMRRCSERRTQDLNIAKKLAFVAVSDFLCWFPIGIMGILSLIGQEFDKETFAWMAVFVLPVNSALNPMIYTIPVIIDGIKRKILSKC